VTYANHQVTLEVRDAGVSAKLSADAPNLEWYAVTVRSLGPNNGVELWLNGNLVGAVPSASGGFSELQLNDLIIGPASAIDIDQLQFDNTAVPPQAICSVISYGQNDPMTGSCNLVRPAIELSFDHGMIDSGFFHLAVQAPVPAMFPVMLGHGLLPPASPQGTFAIDDANLPADMASLKERSFTLWVNTTTSSVHDTIIDTTSMACGDAGNVRCGMLVTYEPAPSPHIHFEVATSTALGQVVDFPITAGRHSIQMIEHHTGDVTTNIGVNVDFTSEQVLPLGAGSLFTPANTRIALPFSGTVASDELQVWPFDFVHASGALCELWLDAQLQPDGGCTRP